MSDTSRPATASDLKRLVDSLNGHGARYLLIGAYALFAHIRVADEITVDLLFSPCAQTYEMLKPHEQIVDLDGVPVHTVSLAGLLLTKQTQRPQDIQDAIVLRRAIEAGAQG